ncbi:acetylhydrolase [Alkalimonas sp. NCh-2]|uniref:alpha/beta hydrolase family protein n=1 Tax=Alkalimonas sp. NCh-2 TaxID=3144846 RepID=UPI0031F6542B
MTLAFLSGLLFAAMTPNTDLAAEQLYPIRPAALQPSLSQPGPYAVGVTTIQAVHPHQWEPASQQYEDRTLLLEVWYPATVATTSALAIYDNVTKSGLPFRLQGHAWRDADALQEQRFPLVVLSHGYTGYRTLMFYLGEHLASHGYVVAALDHPHSTNAEIDALQAPFQGFLNTLYHRSRDQQFVLEHFRQPQSPLQNLIDTNSAAVVGYSMGGYGAINTVGGCFDFPAASIQALTDSSDPEQTAALQQLLNSCAGGQMTDIQVDPAWRAAIAIAPWGGQHRLFSASALQQVQVPIMYWAGDQDDVSDYAGMQWLYDQSGSPSKYLLTYHHARHNIAPHPAPAVARQNAMDFAHYHEPSWSIASINAINQHFALAMLDCHLKQIQHHCTYLQLSPTPTAGQATSPEQSGWPGFPARFDTGLSWQFQHKTP